MSSTTNIKKLRVSDGPHITSNYSTRSIMLMVCFALLPTLIASSFIFGPRVLLLTGVTVATCVGFEAIYCILMKKPVPVGDFSAVVTGLILAFNLPPAFPLWMAMIGSFIAIVIVKQLFGGIGFNFANPALVARAVLQISFAGYMINFTQPKFIDGVAGATPLVGGNNTLAELLLGTHAGVLGETCAITLILGGIFLIATKVISPAIPFTYIGGVFVLKFLLSISSLGFTGALSASLMYILSGGLMLGAFFMATDYTTSPYTLKGKLVFAAGLAVLTVVLREWSNMSEGVSYALLIMGLLVPYINSGCRQKPLGVKGKEKDKKSKEKSVKA